MDILGMGIWDIDILQMGVLQMGILQMGILHDAAIAPGGIVHGIDFSHISAWQSSGWHFLSWHLPHDLAQFNHILEDNLFSNVQKAWNNFIKTGQVWAFLIGLALGYIFRSFTSYG